LADARVVKFLLKYEIADYVKAVEEYRPLIERALDPATLEDMTVEEIDVLGKRVMNTCGYLADVMPFLCYFVNLPGPNLLFKKFMDEAIFNAAPAGRSLLAPRAGLAGPPHARSCSLGRCLPRY